MSLVIFLHFVVVLIGLGALWWAGERVVRYTVKVAQAFNVTPFFISFIILAIAAGIPELSVAIVSGLRGVSDLSAGDIIGANISDIALVIGLTLFLGGPIILRHRDRMKLLIMMAISMGVMSFILYNGFITWFWGILLIFLYVLSIGWIWKKMERHDILHEKLSTLTHKVDLEPETYFKTRAGVLIKLGVYIVIVMGISCITVHHAVTLANILKLPFQIVGATIFAIGTTLPELTMSLNALRKKEFEVALGATLGTVLQQTTLILGILALCSSKPVNFVSLRIPGLFMLISFLVIMIGLYNKRGMGRIMGGGLVLFFISYLLYFVVR